MAAIGSAILGFLGVETAGAAIGAEVAGSSAMAIAAGTAETAGFAATSLGSAAAFDAAAATALTGAGVGASLLQGAGQTVGGAVVSSLLAPKVPALPKPTAMPDPLAQAEAQKKSIIEQTARRGRASTVLTEPAGSGKLGG